MAGVERDKMLYVAFGRRFNPSALTAAREAAGMTTLELHHILTSGDKRTDRVAKYEAGIMRPSTTVLFDLVRILKCNPDELAPRVS